MNKSLRDELRDRLRKGGHGAYVWAVELKALLDAADALDRLRFDVERGRTTYLTMFERLSVERDYFRDLADEVERLREELRSYAERVSELCWFECEPADPDWITWRDESDILLGRTPGDPHWNEPNCD